MGFTPGLTRGRGVGWQAQQRDIAGDFQIIGNVEARAVEHQNRMRARCDLATDVGQMQRYRPGVEIGQHQRRGCAADNFPDTGGAHSAEDIGPDAPLVAWHTRPRAALRPHSGQCAVSGAVSGAVLGAVLADTRVRHGPRTDGGTMAHS